MGALYAKSSTDIGYVGSPKLNSELVDFMHARTRRGEEG